MQGNFSENFEYQTEEWKAKNSSEAKQVQNVHKLCEEYVLNNSKKGDIKDVIRVFDEFCSKNWMMNVGPSKGQSINKFIKEKNSKKILEVGGYCGYSSLLMAESSSPDAKVYSIEISQQYADIARRIQEHAGVKDKTHI